MKSRLDEAIAQARGSDARWDDARASRVLAGVVRKQNTHRALRRGGVAATAVAILVLSVLRLAPGKAEASAATETPSHEEIVASIANGDAGYTRD